MTNIKEKKLNISQAQEIKILRRIVEITNSEPDLKWVLGEIVNVVNDMTKADSVFIYLFDEKKRHLILMASKISHRKELGIVNVYTKEPHAFTQEEIFVLQIVANQAAVAVENTKLMEEALKAKGALETRKMVERAKGLLMKESKMSEDEADKTIHRKSMDTCKPMREIAEAIILAWDMRKYLGRRYRFKS